MISARLARRLALVHKWAALVVGLQLLIWTASGLFFSAVPIAMVRGEALLDAPAASAFSPQDILVTPRQALEAVAEDRPTALRVRALAGEVVYEIRAEIGVFLVSARTGEVLSPISEDLARRIAGAAYAGPGEVGAADYLEVRPREAGSGGPVFRFRLDGGPQSARIYVDAVTGEPGPVRTDLWAFYDFLWGLHIMDYSQRESFNHPLIIVSAGVALLLALAGAGLLVHRLTRGRIKLRTRTDHD